MKLHQMNRNYKHKIEESFLLEFKKKPLVVFSPGRINLIGEHTDYNNGFVFPAAIDKGIYLGIEATDSHSSKIIALDVNESYTCDINKLDRNVQSSWQNYFLGIIDDLTKKGYRFGQFNVVFSGTIDVGSGLSSSAALENAFVYGLNEVFKLGLTRKEMIFISQAAEHNYVGVKCGIMDQFASMFGKKDSALFLDCKSLEYAVKPLKMDGISILVINTNVKHQLSDSAYNKRRASCERVAKHFKVTSLRDINFNDLWRSKQLLHINDFEKASYILEENKRVVAFKEAMESEDFQEMGRLLYASHEGLRVQYEVSCAELDFLVNYGKDRPWVLGSRMMGGGFGGCTINFIKSEKVKDYGQDISNAYLKQFGKACSLINVKLSDGTNRF